MASAPPNFRLQQLEENARPPVGVPQYLKHQVYSDPSVFKRVDDHAIQVSQSNHRTFRDFVFHLVYSQNFNELEKARAIFRWMTSKNMHTIQFQQEPQGSPEEVLTSFRNKKGTYARIYEVICSFSGLHCITLSGYAKGVDYKPGGRLSGSPFNHSWNAVFINGSYIQVDCHWATRYLTSEKNVPENLVYEYDDFYFMTEPQELIYSHWPEEKGWQLLARPLSLAQFEDLPLAKSFFFKCGMQFLNQNRGIINMQNGRLNMSLGYTKPAAFTFKLVYGEYNEEEYRNTKLKRYVLQETLDNMVNFYIRSPREGPYYLTIYSQEVSDKLDVETVFKAACEYKVISDRAADDAVPYPVASDSNWGPGAPVQQYGLTPSHREAVIIAVGGKSEVRFTQSRKVRILCKLTRPGKDDALLEQYVTERSEGQDLVVETALPPNMKGEYALEVYGNDPAKDGDTFTHMCQYLLAYPDSDRKEGSGDLKSYQTYSQTSSYSTSSTSSTTYGQDGYQTTTTKLQSMTIGGPPGKRAGPPTAPKPSRGGGGGVPQGIQYGGGEDDLPPPPPELIEPSNEGRYESAPSFPPPPGSGPVPYGGRKSPATGQYAYRPGQGADDLPPPPPSSQPPYQMQVNIQAPGGDTGRKSPSSQYIPIQHSGPLPYGRKSPTMRGYSSVQPYRPPAAAQQQSAPYGQDLPPPPPPESQPAFQLNIQGPDGGGRRSPSSWQYQPSQVTGAPGSRYQPTTVQTHGPVSVQPTQPGRDSPGGGYQPGYQQNQPGQPGYQQTQPGQYGYQPERVSPVPGYQPGRASPQTGYQPGQPGYQPGQPGYQPGRASPQSGYQPGRASPQSGYQPGYQPGQPGYQQQGAPAGSHEQQPSGIYQATPATTYNVALAPGQQPEANEPGSNLTFKKATHKPGEYQPSTGYTYKPATGIPGPDSKQAEARYSETLTVQIKPPADFTPQPIQQATPAPAPAPPKPVQEQVTEAPPQKVFQYVDKHAVEVSKMQHDSFRDLVWHLIYARNITNELEKARAIFLWLCTKDLKNMKFDNVQKDSPEEILMGLKDGRTTYAQIYETLCSYAGLHCVTLGGYAKGADYRPGMKFTGDQGKHSWNAVLINGTWRLVDCHWAARRLVGKQVTLENVRYELDEYYFLPDPHQLILTHFPDNQEWELLERPVTLQDFENLVPVKSAFFKYGLQMVSHKEAIINCNEEAVVQVACPPYRGNTIAFTFTLAYEDGREEYQGTKLNRFGMQEMVDNISNFRLRPPEVGNYQVIIYAKDVTIETKEGVYGAVCEYRLVCQRAPRPRPFPPVVHTSYGPGDRAGQYQLVPMQRGATVRTVNGKAEVALRMPAELRFMGKLKANDRDEKELDGFVMHRVTNDLAIFTISAPGMGEYGLEIYANDPAKDGNSLFHVWQYLVVCEEAKVQAAPMPKLPPGYLGAQPAFNKLGLSVHSHSDPYIQVDQGELTLKLNSSQPCRMTSQLLYAENSEDYTDYVLQQTKNNQVIFMLKFPKAGLYKFQLFGLPYSDTSESLPGVYNYVINCSMTYSSLVPFPRQFAQWKEGCYLHEPLEGQIPANRPNKGSASSHQHIFFRVEVPKASAVAIVIGEDWTQLDEKQAGLWEGEVSMQGLWGREDKAALCANYGSFKASYSTLLEFSL